MPKKYDPKKIEKKWQKAWDKIPGLYHASDVSKKKKKYVLVEFPYPSGTGLHMGHLRGYTAGDVYSRYLRLKGYEVMFPLGWDAFGLPAENYAIKIGKQPQLTTAKNIYNFKRQIKTLGFSFDMQREVNTTDPAYYKWTQWIFLQFFKAGLAYESTAPINWCPVDKTGLANEEVINGRCERCGAQVEQRNIRQWFLKITAYAQKLLDGLKDLPEWPQAVRLQQENWIGRSEGAEIDFQLQGEDAKFKKKLTVFTTRPDTLFGATYLVLAPESLLLQEMLPHIKNLPQVNSYIKDAANKTDIARTDMQKDKTGEKLLGIFALNPATNEKISVCIADYVLGSYGTGAIMAVPAHDQRDLEFAEKFHLPVKIVIGEDGRLTNSGEFEGMNAEEAGKKIAERFGKLAVKYKLRDWVFARQRYWGEPIPIIHCQKCGMVPVPEKDLPVILPAVKKYEPTGTGASPLAAVSKWVNVKCPKCKGPAKRETNTMPNWAGSSWYFLRYADSNNKKEFASKVKLKRWMPVDIYFGGMEHTTLHLLYSRFWNLFLYDRKLVTVKEPYKRRQPHGIILAHDGEKMSKSKGNVVNPDDYVKKYGADTTRLYQLFLGPHDQAVSWNDNGIVGVYRFLERAYKFASERVNGGFAKKNSEKAERAINLLISKAGSDIESIKFNTVVSSYMEFLNSIWSEDITPRLLADFAIVLSPAAPHLAEEIWQMVLPFLPKNRKKPKTKESVTLQDWPKLNPNKIISSTVNYVVQVNGKFRGNLEMNSSARQAEVENNALKLPTVENAIAGKEIKKKVFVPNKIINFVI